MHHVPQPGRCFMSPSFVLATPNSRVSKGPGYVRNKYPWTNCLQTRYHCWSNSIQFRWSLPLCLSFPLPFLYLFFLVALYLRPARSTYSLENDRSSVDFTRGGFSQLDSVLSASLFFTLLLCSLMRGRHREYRFTFFRIIIDFSPFFLGI